MPVLPEYNVQYYIQGYGGLFIGPPSGSTNPQANTGFQYLNSGETLANRVKFVKENGATFIKHVGSNMYLYVGGLKNGNVLWLTSSQPTPESAINFTVENNLIYITNATDSRYIMHPLGGTPTAGANWGWWITKKVPCYSVQFLPAEDVTVRDIVYHDVDKSLTKNALTSTSASMSNSGLTNLSTTLTLQTTDSTTNEFTYAFSQEFGFKVATNFKGGVPLAEGSVNVELSFRFGASQAVTKSTTSSIEFAIEHKTTVRPGKTATLSATTWKSSGNVRFTAYLVTAAGVEFTREGTVFIKNYYNQTIDAITKPIGGGNQEKQKLAAADVKPVAV